MTKNCPELDSRSRGCAPSEEGGSVAEARVSTLEVLFWSFYFVFGVLLLSSLVF